MLGTSAGASMVYLMAWMYLGLDTSEVVISEGFGPLCLFFLGKPLTKHDRMLWR